MTNKETMTEFGKVVALFLIGFMVIITSSGVWNGVAAGAVDSFYGWVAGINFIIEGFGVYSLYKKWFPKK